MYYNMHSYPFYIVNEFETKFFGSDYILIPYNFTPDKKLILMYE